MFKGIFQKLLFTYILLITVVMISLGLVISLFFNVYYTKQKKQVLIQQGQRIARMVYSADAGKTSFAELYKTISTIGEATNTRIFIAGSRKVSRGFPELDIRSIESELKLDIGKLIQDVPIVRERHFSTILDTNAMLVVLPIRNEGRSKRMIVQYSPLDEIDHTIKNVTNIIWGNALFFLLLSSILIYFVSRRISSPIRRISDAALMVAEGDFDVMVDESGDAELKQLARSFNFMNNKLKGVEIMRRELIANVSHELRTPLASISGFVHGMVDGLIPDEQYQKYHLIILEEINRLTALIKDLLELAKYQADSASLYPCQFNIMDTALSSKESLLMQAKSKNINIQVIGSYDELNIKADEDKVKQVLINIINNSIQYSKDGGNIVIDLKRCLQHIKVSISDDGIGIPADDLPYIFEKFHRVEKSRSPATGGTGLGLSIAKHIIELHGGTIEASSVAGEGTSIVFTIPVSQ